jgi:hypothetical protein
MTETGDAEFAERLARSVLEQAPHTIGLIDREPESPTAGCMDRTHWAWKFTDFAGARFQEGVCVLAFLYTRRLPGSPYVANAALLEWIGMAFDRWTHLQHRDGSFDEAYPNERSLAATAFTSFYVAEALETLGETLQPAIRDRVHRSLRSAGEWLVRNDETHGFLSNHLAAAAAALAHIHRLTGDSRFRQRSGYFRDRILQHQSEEGWYNEYGGADPGYQTHGTFYLARLWQMTGDENLLRSLERSIDFLAHFIHPDGTQTWYPAAFEMLAHRHPTSAWVARRMRPHIFDASAAGLRSIDAWNYFPILNNLVFTLKAVMAGQPEATPRAPDSADGLLWFPGAGLARVRTACYDAYVGVAKGGVIKVWDHEERRLVLSDCGWLGQTFDGRIASTQYHDPDRPAAVTAESIETGGSLAVSQRPVMRPWRFLAFRLFTLTLGRWPAAARWVKQQLVRVLIYRRKPMKVEFNRSIRFGPDRVTIVDELRGDHEGRLENLRRGATFTTVHMGSSRYFVLNELDALPETEKTVDETWHVDPDRLAAGVRVERTLSLA